MLTVTRNRSRRSSPIGCSAIDGAAPVCTLEVGHISSGIALVADVRRQPAELHRADRRPVMSSTIRTPWPSRSAPHHWIASQIDGSPNASPAWMVKWEFSRWQVLERVEVPGGRVAGLGAGDVEAGHAAVAPVRWRARRSRGDRACVPHRGEQAAHRDAGRPALRHAVREAGLHGVDDLVEREPRGDVLLGRVPDLGVHHAVSGEVLPTHSAARRSATQAGLHDRDGVGRTSPAVQHQRAVSRRCREPLARAARPPAARCGRPRRRARRSSPAAAPVEVVVQQHLRRPQDLVPRWPRALH